MTSSSRAGSRLRQWGDAPLLLLIATGMLLGSMLPMSRVARAEGWSPLEFAFWPALGSGLGLAFAGGRICTPISIAAGNVYRKLRMPRGVPASLLAGWSVILAPCCFTSLGYRVYFHFQKVEDPVYFSQFGCVVSATGVLSGLLFFNEHLTLPMRLSIGVILAGIAMVNARSA